MSNKGLIMSIEDNKNAVVLTATGEFCKVPLPKKGQYNIGDELYIGNSSFFANLSTTKWGMIAAAVFAIMIMPLLWKTAVVGPAQEVAYVNIDINPSIELALDSDNLVIKAKGLNNDGNKVLSALNLKDMSAENAINLITNKAEEYKYLATGKDNLVVISVTAKNKGEYQELTTNLEKVVEKDLDEFKLDGKVETISVSPELKAKADQLNLSIGKYAVLLSAIDSGLNISPDEMRSKSIAKAIKALGGDVGSIVRKAHDVDNFDLLAIKHADKLKVKIKDKKLKKRTRTKNEASTNEKDLEETISEDSIILDTDENTNEIKNQDNDNSSKDKEKKNKTKEEDNKDIKAEKDKENGLKKEDKESKKNNNSSNDKEKKVVIKPVLKKPNKPTKPDLPEEPTDPKENNNSNKNKKNDNEEAN